MIVNLKIPYMANIQLNQTRFPFFFLFGKKLKPGLNQQKDPKPTVKMKNYANLLIVPNNLESHIVALLDKGLS